MRLASLEEKAQDMLREEKEQLATETIKGRIKEIEYLERTLAKLKNQYSELLTKDLDDVFYGE